MDKRRIKINYRKVDITQLAVWMEANKYKYALVPYDMNVQHLDNIGSVKIGSLIMYIEVYTEEAEVATRLQWNVE